MSVNLEQRSEVHSLMFFFLLIQFWWYHNIFIFNGKATEAFSLNRQYYYSWTMTRYWCCTFLLFDENLIAKILMLVRGWIWMMLTGKTRIEKGLSNQNIVGSFQHTKYAPTKERQVYCFTRKFMWHLPRCDTTLRAPETRNRVSNV